MKMAVCGQTNMKILKYILIYLVSREKLVERGKEEKHL